MLLEIGLLHVKEYLLCVVGEGKEVSISHFAVNKQKQKHNKKNPKKTKNNPKNTKQTIQAVAERRWILPLQILC